MKKTAEKANEVSKYLEETHTVWQELKELKKYIQRVTQ
ncbi:hypothetical protein CWATWH8502_4039 [Crocosphaera watsonii WH 8502]|uniref:Uncharacterized protein n=3 Tax=Crocosphaera TaxID=263510 RepID=T2JCG4_CROWT|nr:hypothetical protein CWATWH8502_4039 [Crocosphaera watsonii WH 8502]CCQ62905.1 hypothetical protein CWATWH0401_4069 [Crocosphaera watsonii WH 0401]